ncbi:MAG: FG-GAP repeat domain-containing protein [Oscillospiraceae bacterium]
MKKIIVIIVSAACLLSFPGCFISGNRLSSQIPDKAKEGYKIAACVLYCGPESDGGWYDTFCYLEQSSIVNLTVDAVDITGSSGYFLSGYDVLYLDKSLINADNISDICADIVSFTYDGGAVFLDNAFYNVFDKEFIGAKDYVKLTQCPVELKFPRSGDDIGELQEIIRDYASLYKSFADYDKLREQDYGYALICDTALPIAKWKGRAIYSLNRYGSGYVFFTNPLLPNAFSASSYTMKRLNGQQLPFSDTTAGCGKLLLDAFAGYVSKQVYGYYIGRVYGSFGSPDMAWELHYEEITGIEHNSMKIFSELCREYLQVPSFTLIRNPYWWFLRSETVTYYMNEDRLGSLSYSLDFYENAYSSGTHVESGGKWLSFGSVEDAGSYFIDYPEYDYRAYPELCDYNKDGICDIFCGSSDGKIYYCEGIGFDTRLHVSEAKAVTDTKGAELKLPGYSAPQLLDIDGDGFEDIISGCADGDIYWFSGNGTSCFEPRGILLDTDLRNQSLPSVGDINSDGISDLAIGSNEAVLLLFYGSKSGDGSLSFGYGNMDALSRKCADASLGKWLAPEVADIDRDGINELAVGTFQGYVAVFDRDESGQLNFKSYITAGEMNYKGNSNIKTGNNCVPAFYDINGDLGLDLVCGSLEYGLAYPIDSEYFPCPDEVREQIEYAEENEYCLGVHFYTNAYASGEREEYELLRHKEALGKYGLNTEFLGTNQHTWYTSSLGPAQSFLSAYKAGLLWNSGYAPPGSSFISPQTAAECVVSLPFYLVDGGEKTILMQNCSVLPYRGSEWTDISAKYGVPICVYYHCDFVYESDEEAREYLGRLSDFWWENSYNFACEDQLMAATAAAMNLTVSIEGKNLSRGEAIDISISPGFISDDFPLYDEEYQNSVGAKIVFSEKVDVSGIVTDADVWRREGNSLFIALNKTVSVRGAGTLGTGAHIERVNIAAEIEAYENGARISFLDGGMMQAVVSGKAGTGSAGWTVTQREDKTIFTKYGAADVLIIGYGS